MKGRNGKPLHEYTIKAQKAGVWLSQGCTVKCNYREAVQRARAYAQRTNANEIAIFRDGDRIAWAKVTVSLSWYEGNYS